MEPNTAKKTNNAQPAEVKPARTPAETIFDNVTKNQFANVADHVSLQGLREAIRGLKYEQALHEFDNYA